MNVPDNLKYQKSHEWLRVDDGDIATVGVTDYAQAEMTEVVYVELPEVGRNCSAGEEVAVVESVKSASDIYSPVTGEIVEVNDALTDDPGTINSAPFEGGWIFKIRITDPGELDSLLTAETYRDNIS